MASNQITDLSCLVPCIKNDARSRSLKAWSFMSMKKGNKSRNSGNPLLVG